MGTKNFSAKLILDSKREGRALSGSEIRYFIEGFTRGEIPDYQMSALAMAICCRGMTQRETADLTETMRQSGRSLSWDGLITADKHSTGGVGDKLSLIIQPIVAACGVAVPSLTGRGLGITGGTADKLETIPGYNAALSLEDFEKVVREVGVSMTVQTAEITPADKKLYALRDVTGTVASVPLIVASILSKKLAEGAGVLVFDVKFGSGAFMKTLDEARTLAQALVDGAKASGRKSAALITDMSQPLGYCVGNANEVMEAIEILKSGRSDFDGNVGSGDEVALSVELAAMMVSLSKNISLEEARAMCATKLADLSAFEKFKAMVNAQGGDLDKFYRAFTAPVFKFKIQAMRSGYVSDISAERVAHVALSLGAGREKAGDRIDPLAGVALAVKRGDRIAVGSPLATLSSSQAPEVLEGAAAELLKAFTISHSAGESQPMILERIF
jgi:pyrimidine-nucleoside phosphorylase